MNNIERIENTESLEKLEKLDLTLNFIGQLTSSIEILKCNLGLKSLYLIGNPCTEFEFYHEYVIGKIEAYALKKRLIWSTKYYLAAFNESIRLNINLIIVPFHENFD